MWQFYQKKILAIPLAAAILCACSAPAARGIGGGPADGDQPVDVVAAPPAPDGGIPASEIEARYLLDGLFRASGLRILNDVTIVSEAMEVTLDGFDPDRRVGYEYIAPEERGFDLSPEERLAARSAGFTILVLDADTKDKLRARARVFLLEHAKDIAGE